MRTTPAMRARTSAGLAVALAVTVGGCGSDDEDNQTTVGHWVISEGESWKDAKPLGSPWTHAYKVGQMEVQVAGEYSDDQSALHVLGQLDLPATMKLKGYESIKTNDVTIDDAHEAMVRYYSYTHKGKTRNGAWIVATQWPHPASAVISISAPTLDRQKVGEIIDGLKFTKNEKTGPREPGASKPGVATGG